VILAGPPGNGKTLSLKVLAKTLPCTFLWCTPVHVRELGFPFIYGFARELAPTVVMAEDADAFGLDRRLGQFNMVLGELLQILDGFEENKGVITVLSSNYAEVLDSALTKRPGRFDVKILVGPPGPNEALKMIKRTMEKRQVVFDGDAGVLHGAAAEMAKHSASGAYVIDMVNYAMMLAVERGQGTQSRLRVTQKDITDSTTRTVSSLELSETMERSVAAEGVYKWGGWASLPKEPNSER
jgi:ATP-dependent 26S proteasome regulatory subunit